MNYGSYIKIYRTLTNTSASNLCDGICTISTLSKIENKTNNISIDIVNQILNRLNSTNIQTLQENSHFLKPIVDSFYLQLELNMDRSDLLKKIQNNKKLFLHSEYISFYYIAEIFKNYDLFELKSSDISITTKLRDIIQFGNTKDIYYFTLAQTIAENKRDKKLLTLESESKNDSFGWFTYYYADILFHENQLKHSIQISERGYDIACKNCNISLMYGTLLLSGLCSLNLQEENQTLNYFAKLNHLKPFIKYDIESITNYNIGATLLEQNKIEEAGLYLNQFEDKDYKYDFESFNIIHKLAYYYVSIKNSEKSKKYINWLINYANDSSSNNKNILNKIIESLKIKLEENDFLQNKTYQEDIEYIYKYSSKYISYGFKHFYFQDIENVYLAQRRYKDLYYLYSKKGNF